MVTKTMMFNPMHILSNRVIIIHIIYEEDLYATTQLFFDSLFVFHLFLFLKE